MIYILLFILLFLTFIYFQVKNTIKMNKCITYHEDETITIDFSKLKK